MEPRVLAPRVRSVFLALVLVPLLQACGVATTVHIPANRGAPSNAVRGIPPGHMPPPGSCRVWYPGEPPGQQPPPGDCEELLTVVPTGAWLIHRPTEERRVYRVD